ncbi:putative serine/threonine-protein kinase 11-interacting protein, partial [Apostichopus japonicus]
MQFDITFTRLAFEIYCTVSICLHGDPFSIEIGAGSSCPMMDDTTSTRRDLVMELYNFVKDGNLENNLLMKEKKLSILSSHLSSLNKVFVTYNSNEILDAARREAVEFLRDFCFRIPALKLVHGADSPQGAIDVSRLHSLTHLEIGKAPVHMLVGLRALRQQLQVLICTRCLHSIEILVGKCGGDIADEEDWPHLHTLNLSFNYLTSLDTSLQFLPSLRVLDLSHNQIKNSGKFLECCTELQHVNLSYNSLTRVPSLSQVSQRKLKSLNLRNNNLEYLDDVHLYENLESLELTRNCIYSEQPLMALNSVWQITKINLHGNPISQAPLYRQLVTKNLPLERHLERSFQHRERPSITAFSEVETYRCLLSPKRPALPSNPWTVSRSQQTTALRNDQIAESEGKRRKRRGSDMWSSQNKHKMKTCLLSVSLETSMDFYESTTVTPKSLEVSYMDDAKKEFERKREEHGHDWLLSLQAPYKKPSEPINGGDSLNPFINVEWDERETHPDSSMDIQGETKDEDEEVIVKESEEAEPVTVKVEVSKAREDEVRPEVEEEESARVTAGSLPKEAGNSLPREVEREVAVNESFPELDNTRNSSGIDLEYDFHTNGMVITTQELIPESDLEKTELQRTDSEEDLCGPLLVKVATGAGSEFTEMLLTVKQTHLEESDLNGEVQERLELQSLLSVEVLEKNLPNEGLVPVVELNFEYVRKDRRQRKYWMEDQSSAEMLSAVLESFWQENQRTKVTQFMSCLKCAKEFPLSKAIMVVDKPKGRKTSDQQEFALNEIPTCPFCGNRYLVEKEHGSFNNGDRTPVIGSLSSTGDSKPLATSSPWKARENGQISSSLGQEPFISTRLYSKSPSITSPSGSLATVVNAGSSDGRPNDSFNSEVLDVSLRLPESTIPAHSIDARTPIEYVAHYPTDQLDMLLKSDKYQFRDRYSLMPQVSVDASSLQGTPQRASSSASDRGGIGGRGTGEKQATEAEVEDIYGGKSGLSEEDEIEILEESYENQGPEIVEGHPSIGKGRGSASSRNIVLTQGRNSSNESDIAVLSDREHQESDHPRGRVDSITSDNVFGNPDVGGDALKGRKNSFEKDEEGGGYLSSYERKKTDSSLNGSGSYSDRESRKERKVSILTRVRDDLESADHRLKLFYSMSLFATDDEQFQCHVVGIICSPSMLGLVYYEGLVVISTSHIYVLKVFKEESEKPSDFLTKRLNFSMQEVLYIHVGVGSQLIQFEMAADGGRFTLMTGDSITVERFAKRIQESLTLLKDSPHTKFQGVERNHMEVQDSLLSQISEDGDVNLEETVYIHALDTKQKDASSSYMRQGIFITESNIYLLLENCSWPLIGLKSTAKVTTKGQHFALKEHFSITDVTDLECNMQELKVVINFSDE